MPFPKQTQVPSRNVPQITHSDNMIIKLQPYSESLSSLPPKKVPALRCLEETACEEKSDAVEVQYSIKSLFSTMNVKFRLNSKVTDQKAMKQVNVKLIR